MKKSEEVGSCIRKKGSLITNFNSWKKSFGGGERWRIRVGYL